MNIVNISEAPYRHPSLKGDMLFRLWKAAIKTTTRWPTS